MTRATAKCSGGASSTRAPSTSVMPSRSVWMSSTPSVFFFSSRRRHTRFDCDWSSDVCSSDLGDRHLIVVDRDRWVLFELFATRWTGQRWEAGSGAVFDLSANGRRPEGWTSADAAGLAILPGLVRFDEAMRGPIRHALRATVRSTNGYVWPASHRAGSTARALPMGARLRLKSSVDVSRFPGYIQNIFRAMQTHGLIIADNGSDMYISGEIGRAHV